MFRIVAVSTLVVGSLAMMSIAEGAPPVASKPPETNLHVSGPAPLGALPTSNQLDWQDNELTMFVHFGVNTFTDREWGEGTEDEKVFNPARLDAGQWARTAKAAGFKMMILTAKHHDGFCLWPSKYTEHSVKNSPWRGGKGDVVGEFVAACRKEGLKVGLYLSPWDRHEKSYGDSPAYNEHYRKQLAELLTQYGEIREIWFDGACGEGPNGKRQEYDWPSVWGLARKLAPKAILFSDAGPDARWIGNEDGIAGDPCWSTVDPKHAKAPGIVDDVKNLQSGDRGGSVWRPGESDVSIRPGWFYHQAEDDKVKSADHLVDLYFKSVGRNSLLLLNVPPDKDGLFGDADVKRLAEFRARLDGIFKTDLARGKAATASNVRGGDKTFGPSCAVDGSGDTYWATDDTVTEGWIEVDLGKPVTFNVASLREMISLGQRVEAYRIEAWQDGAWKTLVKGTTIGHRKLDRFEPVTAQRVRVVIEKSLACLTLREFSLHLDASH